MTFDPAPDRRRPSRRPPSSRPATRCPSATETLLIEGMTCASCVARNEKALRRVPGVVRADVNLATEKATVEYLARHGQPRRPGGGRAAGRLRSSRAGPPHGRGRHRATPRARARRASSPTPTPSPAAPPTCACAARSSSARCCRRSSFWAAWDLPSCPSFLTNGWVLWALATPVQFWVGRQFYRAALAAARHGSTTMDTLVALGSSAAYFYSAAGVLFPGLLRPPRPRRADVLRLGGAHHHPHPAGPPVRGARQGPDRRGHPHAHRPAAAHGAGGARRRRARRADRRGRATTTSCACAPARRCRSTASSSRARRRSTRRMLTGEALPVVKGPGDEVIGATLNTTGTFTLRATRVGAETALAQIVRLVEQAQGARPPIARLADLIASWFVPAVMAVAAATFVVWLLAGPQPALNYALVNAIAVLVIACPVRPGPGDADGGHGRHRQGRPERRADPRRRLAGDGPHSCRRSCSTRPAPSPQGRPTVTDVVLAGDDGERGCGELARRAAAPGRGGRARLGASAGRGRRARRGRARPRAARRRASFAPRPVTACGPSSRATRCWSATSGS